MTLIICPGMHGPALSDRFVAALSQKLALLSSEDGAVEQSYSIVSDLPTFSGLTVAGYLQRWADPQKPLLLVAFSAGVVGAIAAAQLWQAQGRSVQAFIAVDGWGVPQLGSFPFHRVSHDHFTHWSSALLGAGQDSFYADPAVDHLDLWQFPDQAVGWWVSGGASPVKSTAIQFIAQLLQRYGCGTSLQRRDEK